MATIPDYMTPRLAAVGVTDPQASRWRHLPNVDSGQCSLFEIICECTGKHRRVTCVPVETNNGTLLVGQCSDCTTITAFWWRSREKMYTGPAALEASREMYAPGQGASTRPRVQGAQ